MMRPAVVFLVLAIIGIGAFLSIRETTLACSGEDPERKKCEEDLYQTLVRKYGAAHALQIIEEQFERDEYIRTHCHSLAHMIGYAAVDTYPSVAEAYADGSPFCWDGYYHGVVERIVARDGPGTAESMLPRVCSTFGADAGKMFDYEACTHGVGHAAFVINNSLIPSLNFCTSVFPDGRPQHACISGVFMAQVSSGASSTSPLYPCDAVSQKYASHCYPYQMTKILERLGGDYSRAFQLCADVADPASRTACQTAIGRAFVITDLDRTETQSTTVCELGADTEARSDCYTGIAKQIVRLFRSTDAAFSFCATVPDLVKGSCRDVTKRQFEEISSNVSE